jgi:hypothetical protein
MTEDELIGQTVGQPRYWIQTRVSKSGPRYAVIRTGRKGGRRTVSVWINESIAKRVAEMLNTYAGTEA